MCVFSGTVPVLVSESCDILINKVYAELKSCYFISIWSTQFGGQNLHVLFMHMGVCSLYLL